MQKLEGGRKIALLATMLRSLLESPLQSMQRCPCGKQTLLRLSTKGTTVTYTLTVVNERCRKSLAMHAAATIELGVIFRETLDAVNKSSSEDPSDLTTCELQTA